MKYQGKITNRVTHFDRYVEIWCQFYEFTELFSITTGLHVKSQDEVNAVIFTMVFAFSEHAYPAEHSMKLLTNSDIHNYYKRNNDKLRLPSERRNWGKQSRRVASQFFMVSPRDHFVCPEPSFSEMKEIG